MGLISNRFGTPGIEGPVRDWASYHPVAVQAAPEWWREWTGPFYISVEDYET